MKTFKVRCRVHGEAGWFQVHVGRPAPGFHPLKYQAAWLREIQGGEIDAEAMAVLGAIQQEPATGHFSSRSKR